MQIIESKQDIETFLLYWDKEPSLVIPMWADLDKHPMNNSLSFLYVRFRDDETDQGDMPIDFIIPIHHNDCMIPIIDLTNSIQPKMVWNTKGLHQTTVGIKNMADLHAHYFFNFNQHIDLQEITSLLTNFYNKVGLRDDLGKSISIMKFGEILRKFSTPYLDSLNDIKDTYMNGMINTLSRMEQNGIRVDRGKFFDKWPDHGKHLDGDIIYTEYNPYVMTSRPPNRHGGINFSALNKSDGTREIFIPREGKMFVQFDYDAYHVRLIAEMIGFEIPFDVQGHQELADMYGCSYDESKPRTFKILYGGVKEEDKKIPFFNEVDIYIRNMWEDVKVSGKFTTPNGRDIKLEWMDKPNAQKVFNYLLQATETEKNIEMINKLYANDINSMLFYTYDSFLFEMTEGDIYNQGSDIKKILESTGFPVKGSWGTDYSKL